MSGLVIPDDPSWNWAYEGILYVSGEHFPKANESDLRALSDDLDSFAREVQEAANGVNGFAGNVYEALEGRTANAFYSANKNVMDGIPENAAMAIDLANRTRDFANDTEHTKYAVTIAMFTTVLDIFMAMASGFPELVPGLITAGGAAVRTLIPGTQAAPAGLDRKGHQGPPDPQGPQGRPAG